MLSELTATNVYAVQTALSGHAFFVPSGGDLANCTLVQLWGCLEANAKQRCSRIGNQLRWAGQYACLDVIDGVTTADVKLQIEDCDGGNEHQSWRSKRSLAPRPRRGGRCGECCGP